MVFVVTFVFPEAGWEAKMPGKYRDGSEAGIEAEEQGSLLMMLITFVAMVAFAAIVCGVVWKVTHKEAKPDISNVQVPVTPSITETLVQVADGEEGSVTESAEPEIDPINGDATMHFEPVDEDVTAKDAAIIRILPNTEGITTVAGQLRNGQFLKRIGINKETGWSKVMFNGQEGYAVSYMLTTDRQYETPELDNPDNRVTTQDGYVILFRDCDDEVTAKEYVNLRTEPSTAQGSATVSAQLKTGLTARRTGVSIDSGWSRVEFNGLVLYVVTNFVQPVGEE